MIERRYSLVRVAAGDYLLPSNDRETLWRIYSYREDGSLEVERAGGGFRKVTGQFWAAARYKRSLEPTVLPDDALEWDNWETWEAGCATRAEAIEEALRAASRIAAASGRA